MTAFSAIARMPPAELRGVWWRLNDPVLRETVPERPGARAAVMERAKVLRIELKEPGL